MKIEEGCLAVVIGSCHDENNGKTVVVGKYLGHDNEPFDKSPLWEVDKPMKVTTEIKAHGKVVDVFTRYESVMSEPKLLRIDGHKEPEESNQDEVIPAQEEA